MIILRDIKLGFKKKFVILGLVFGILGIVASIIPTYGVFASIFFFILSFFFVLFANRLSKSFEGHFDEEIKMTDSFHVVLRDKDGNIKAERKSS